MIIGNVTHIIFLRLSAESLFFCFWLCKIDIKRRL